MWDFVQEWAPFYFLVGTLLAVLMQVLYWMPLRATANQLLASAEILGFAQYKLARAAYSRVRAASITSLMAEFTLWPIYAPGGLWAMIQLSGGASDVARLQAAYVYVSRASESIEQQRRNTESIDVLVNMFQDGEANTAWREKVSGEGVERAMRSWVVGPAVPRTDRSELEWIRALLHVSGMYVGQSRTHFSATQMLPLVSGLGLAEPARNYLTEVLCRAKEAEKHEAD